MIGKFQKKERFLLDSETNNKLCDKHSSLWTLLTNNFQQPITNYWSYFKKAINTTYCSFMSLYRWSKRFNYLLLWLVNWIDFPTFYHHYFYLTNPLGKPLKKLLQKPSKLLEMMCRIICYSRLYLQVKDFNPLYDSLTSQLNNNGLKSNYDLKEINFYKICNERIDLFLNESKNTKANSVFDCVFNKVIVKKLNKEDCELNSWQLTYYNQKQCLIFLTQILGIGLSKEMISLSFLNKKAKEDAFIAQFLQIINEIINFNEQK